MRIKYLDFVRITIFFVVFCLIFFWLSKVFYPKYENRSDTLMRTNTFYIQPKNSIDIILIGTSSFLSGILPLTIWEQTGVPVYMRSSDMLASASMYYYLVETLKYQHPKVVVLEGNQLINPYDVDAHESIFRRQIDPLKFSLEKIKLTKYITSISKKQTITSYIFPIFRFHTRWDELTKKDFENYKIERYDYQKGAFAAIEIEPVEFPNSFMNSDSSSPSQIDYESLDYYLRIIKLCKKNNIHVMLVTLPRISWSNESHLVLQEFANQYGLHYLDYNLPSLMKDVEFDQLTDMHDKWHMSIFGALKTSRHLGNFLQETYDIPSKRNDPLYEQWNIDLKRFQTDVSKLMQE